MSELQIIEIVLLTIVGCILIALVARDMVTTTHLCLVNNRRNFGQHLYCSSGFWITGILSRFVRKHNRRGAFWGNINIIVPALQFIIWKGLLIAGFAFLYLAIDWQTLDETVACSLGEEFFSALWLSFAISFRIALYNLVLEDPMIFLVANAQFYQGLLFYAFICFYFMTLRQKAKRLQPRLYNLKYEPAADYSPFLLSDSLRRSSGSHNLVFILQEWERWAVELKNNLSAHPHLIYSISRRGRCRSWLAALNIILDASAALIVSSGSSHPIERQARRTFGAARRALVETADHLGLLQKQDSAALPFHQTNKRSLCDDDNDQVLSADLIVETEEDYAAQQEIEMFGVWRYTYQSSLRAVSDYLDVEIPSTRYNGGKR